MTVFQRGPSTPGTAHPQFKGKLARTMVVALVLVSLLPLIIMGVAAYSQSNNLLKIQTSTQLENVVRANAQEIRDEFKIKELRLALIGNLPDFKYPAWGAFATTNSSLRNDAISAFTEYNKSEESIYFQEFLIVDLQGIVRFSSNEDWEGLDISSSTYFKELGGDTHSFTAFDLSPLSAENFVIFTATPYFDNQDREQGYLVGLTAEDAIISILTKMESAIPEATVFFAINNQTLIRPDQDTNKLTLFTPPDEQRNAIQKLLLEIDTSSQEISIATLEYTNEQNALLATAANWIPDLELGVVIELPQSQIFGELTNLTPFIFSLLAISILAMVVIISITINRMVKPLLSLVDTTNRFTEGDWRERSTVERNDEIGLLAYSFNKMADELSTLYRSLEYRVEESANKLRTAAEVAQNITATRDQDELLQKAADLISDRFDYLYTGIFILDRGGRYAILRAAHGPNADEMLARKHRFATDSPSVVGWVAANNLPRVVTLESGDPIHFTNELLPETRSEAGIPIALNEQLLGVLNVQSQEKNAFEAEDLITLQTLSSQIAASLQNISLSESTQVNFQELDNLYRSSQRIGQAHSRENVIERTGTALRQTSFITALYTNESGKMTFAYASNPDDPSAQIPIGMRELQINIAELTEALSTGTIMTELGRASTAPAELTQALRQLGCKVAAIIPMASGETLHGMMALGTDQEGQLTLAAVQPYLSLADTVAATLEKLAAEKIIQQRLSELEAISNATQNISAVDNLNTLYSVMHDQIRQTLGDFNFLISLYDPHTDSISIPYMYEGGNVTELEPFQLGEGLISILIRTHQPLMLVEDTEKRATALGAKVVGRPAKSWLGAPLMIGNDAVGAIVIQDTEKELAFDENDLRFMTALATQAAGAINNVRLLEESRTRSLQLEMAAEIARDVGSALDLDELLTRAIYLIKNRFDFYHASVFLIDTVNEYAVIRESTGEAGAQMKRANHKLRVGSKSIVGYVASQGEPLVVNDTTKDATHYANPLLPDTRAEAAIPLKVGERIVGVLDVQNTASYAFTDEIMRTLTILSDQLAIAVVNSELFAETQEHLSQHRLLHHITTSAASGTTLDEALESAVQGLQVTLGGDRVAILLADKEKENLEITAAIGYSEEDTENLSIPIGTGVTGWVAEHRAPLRIENVSADSRYIQVSANTKSELALPLIFRNELLGVLNVESEMPAAYDDHDEEMLGTLAGSLAAIIANARLLEQIRRQVDRERLLYEVTSKIRRSTDMKTILQTTASELNKVVGARRTQIKIEPEKTETGKN